MDTIYYTGIGARKSGKHTKKQYLDVMNKHFKNECATYTKSLKCKSCKQLNGMIHGLLKKSIKASKSKTNKKIMTKKATQKFNKAINNCNKCKNNNLKPCDFNKYISFSGAEVNSDKM